MARSDWNEFYIQDFPIYWFRRSYPYSQVGAGLGDNCLFMQGYGSDDWDTFGFLYNGAGQPAQALIRDGSITMSMRVPNQNFGYHAQFFGTIMRSQTLFPDSKNTQPAWTDADFYAMGVWFDHTEDATNCRCAFWRVLNGTYTRLREDWIPNFDPTQYWMQFETRLVNDVSDNVEYWLRYNTGTEWAEPGQGSWSTWSKRYTDTGHGGVLNQAGYWGFGRTEASGYSGGSSQWVMVDNIMIAREIYD